MLYQNYVYVFKTNKDNLFEKTKNPKKYNIVANLRQSERHHLQIS